MTNILSSLNMVDYVLLGLIALGLILGLKKGLSAMVSKLLSLGGTVLTALYYYSPAAKWLSVHSPLPTRSAQALMYFLIAVAGWIAFDIIFKIISKVMEVKFSERLSRLGGLLLGGLWMYLLGGFLLYSFLIFKAPFLDPDLAKSSYLAPRVSSLPQTAYEFVFREPPQTPAV